MKITENDVGLVAIDSDGDEWTIIAFAPDLECPVVGICGSVTDRFTTDGTALGTCDLIRFADEPESKPPPETVAVLFDSPSGLAFIRTAPKRPDLAGQTFTYRLEKK